MKRPALFLILIFLSALGSTGRALSISETFTTATYKDATQTTGVWNIQLNTVHSPLAVTYTSGTNAENSLDADVGDGSDGPFNATTFSNFGAITSDGLGHQVLTIDTSVRSSFQFTSMNVPNGWLITGTQPNPLWFKVQGSVQIDGIIDCSGTDGAAGAAGGAQPQGGVGRCGGGNGGKGGYSGGAAQGGSAGGPTPTGGGGGTSAATGSGGGGGGGYQITGYVNTAGSNTVGGAAPGAAGTNFPNAPANGDNGDMNFLEFGPVTGPGGGSGGGGGGYSTGASFTGGGGGAGGGGIRITAVGNIVVSATGQVFAKSGKGGASTSAGGGGGGAGGSIWFQTPGTITNNGSIMASDNNTTPNGGAGTNAGGHGTNGRTWLVSQASFAGGSSAEVPISARFLVLPGDNGEIHYAIDPFVAVSKPYDARNTVPAYTLAAMITSLPSTSTATLFIAGSNDAFVKDDSGWQPTSNVGALTGKRYFRFKIAFQTTYAAGMATSSASIGAVSVTYNGAKQTNFNFTPSCGYLGGPGEGLFFVSLLLLIFAFTTVSLRTRGRRPHTTTLRPG